MKCPFDLTNKKAVIEFKEEELIKLFEEHYWDSLYIEKDLIMKHIKYVLSVYNKDN